MTEFPKSIKRADLDAMEENILQQHRDAREKLKGTGYEDTADRIGDTVLQWIHTARKCKFTWMPIPITDD